MFEKHCKGVLGNAFLYLGGHGPDQRLGDIEVVEDRLLVRDGFLRGHVVPRLRLVSVSPPHQAVFTVTGHNVSVMHKSRAGVVLVL